MSDLHDLLPRESCTDLRLTHSGFYDKAAMQRHGGSWPQILDHFDEVLTKGS